MSKFFSPIPKLPALPANGNYARELLRLFTIGLEMLNLDGALPRDASGATSGGWLKLQQHRHDDSAWRAYRRLEPVVYMVGGPVQQCGRRRHLIRS